MTAKYIHYGSSSFDINLFEPIHNRVLFNKPYGGLWASPCVCDLGWKDWCEAESYKTEKLSKHFTFKLKDDASIITICTNANLVMLDVMGYCIHPSKYTYSPYAPDQYYLDFEKLLLDGYDAVQVYISDDTYWSLYGWDCDSLLVLNPDSIIETVE